MCIGRLEQSSAVIETSLLENAAKLAGPFGHCRVQGAGFPPDIGALTPGVG